MTSRKDNLIKIFNALSSGGGVDCSINLSSEEAIVACSRFKRVSIEKDKTTLFYKVANKHTNDNSSRNTILHQVFNALGNSDIEVQVIMSVLEHRIISKQFLALNFKQTKYIDPDNVIYHVSFKN